MFYTERILFSRILMTGWIEWHEDDFRVCFSAAYGIICSDP